MILTLALLLALAPPQPAAQPASATNAQEMPSGPTIHVDGSRRRWDPERIVCRDVAQPGSRLNSQRVCRSMLEWASAKREEQQLLIQKQYNGAK
jgi:hypothetical protein